MTHIVKPQPAKWSGCAFPYDNCSPEPLARVQSVSGGFAACPLRRRCDKFAPRRTPALLRTRRVEDQVLAAWKYILSGSIAAVHHSAFQEPCQSRHCIAV